MEGKKQENDNTIKNQIHVYIEVYLLTTWHLSYSEVPVTTCTEV